MDSKRSREKSLNFFREAMHYLTHIFETKGLAHGIERAAQIFRRFAFGRQRFRKMMKDLEGGLGDCGVKVTFCLTASLLEDHSEFVRSFIGNGHEFAAHGYYHTNMKGKARNEQFNIVKKSYETFRAHNIPVKGFRCPYLSYNSHTIEALNRSRFSWTSNDMILWDSFPHGNSAREHFRRLSHIYRFLDAGKTLSLPRISDGIISIPITAPDDEMVYERMSLKNGEIGRIWTDILNRVHDRGELFHLLFHPERFEYVKASIAHLMEYSRGLSPQVWTTTLDRLSGWWQERKESRWSYERVNSKTSRIILHAPASSTILVKSPSSMRPPFFYKTYRPIEATARTGGLFIFTVDDPFKYMIAIPENAPESLAAFLSEEGFFVNRTSRPGNETLYLDGYGTFVDEDRIHLLDRLDNCRYPLIRLWRWPEGARCALAVSSDVDSISLLDFFKRAANFT